jgi:hypothetical protein
VISIAVLEHCGSYERQKDFVSRIEALGKYFFVTTPYRWFPVEVHTFFPFLHWLPRSWHRWILRNIFREDFWSREENLNLLGACEARRLFSSAPGLLHSFSRFAGFRSNQIFVRSPRT